MTTVIRIEDGQTKGIRVGFSQSDDHESVHARFQVDGGFDGNSVTFEDSEGRTDMTSGQFVQAFTLAPGDEAWVQIQVAGVAGHADLSGVKFQLSPLNSNEVIEQREYYFDLQQDSAWSIVETEI